MADRLADAVGRVVGGHAAAVMGLYMLYEWSPECSTCRQPRGVNGHCLECVFDPSTMVEMIHR